MKAMVFAAGLGTRLRPLTDDRPKALVTIAGRTLLEITLSRLRAAGVNDVIINVHHFADRIAEYLEANRNFGLSIALSREETLLDTGGGLLKASWFFLESGSGDDGEPFLVHNVDVLSTIDLGAMVRFHTERKALTTLAVQPRSTSRPLLFDEQGQFCGRGTPRGTGPVSTAPQQDVNAFAFCGVHVLSPRIFAQLHEPGAFSIIDAYAKLATEKNRILAFRADGAYWLDLGKPESISQAERDVADGKYRLN